MFILSKLYCISDIHGSYEAFSRAINFLRNEKNVDFSVDKLVLLGDYVDRGPQSREVLEKIIKMRQEYGKSQIIALLGNHEVMFKNWLKNSYDYLSLHNGGLETILSFIGDYFCLDGKNLVYDGVGHLFNALYQDKTKDVVGYIYQNCSDILDFLFNELELYYEDGNTLFVHAGFDETPGKHWSESSESDIVWMYPAQYGYTPWNKRIVAGHIMTRELHRSTVPKEKVNGIYRNKDHIYIDGAAIITGKVNILMVDTNKDLYYDAWTGKEII